MIVSVIFAAFFCEQIVRVVTYNVWMGNIVLTKMKVNSLNPEISW